MKLISHNLEKGKAGEHLALFEIISQGFIGFLSDQGLPYDIVVDYNGVMLRGQVKTTSGHRDYGGSINCLRFGTRSAKGAVRSSSVKDCDFYALVSIEDKIVSFFHISELESGANSGRVKQTIEIRKKGVEVNLKKGTSRMLVADDYFLFDRVINIEIGVKK